MNSGYARDYRRWTIINFWPVGNHWRWWCAGVLCNTRRISSERKWAEVKVVLWCTVYPSVFLYSHRNEKAQQQQKRNMYNHLRFHLRECFYLCSGETVNAQRPIKSENGHLLQAVYHLLCFPLLLSSFPVSFSDITHQMRPDALALAIRVVVMANEEDVMHIRSA